MVLSARSVTPTMVQKDPKAHCLPDLPTHFLYHECLSRRIHPNCVSFFFFTYFLCWILQPVRRSEDEAVHSEALRRFGAAPLAWVRPSWFFYERMDPTRRATLSRPSDLVLQLRQLFSKRHGGRQADQPGLVGYCWPGRLRSSSTTLLPSDRRVLDLLLNRVSSIIR